MFAPLVEHAYILALFQIPHVFNLTLRLSGWENLEMVLNYTRLVKFNDSM